MRTRLLSLLAGTALLGGVASAQAGQPVTLTEAQMDVVSAGGVVRGNPFRNQRLSQNQRQANVIYVPQNIIVIAAGSGNNTATATNFNAVTQDNTGLQTAGQAYINPIADLDQTQNVQNVTYAPQGAIAIAAGIGIKYASATNFNAVSQQNLSGQDALQIGAFEYQ